MQLANRRVLIVAGVIIGLALVIVIVLAIAKSNTSNSSATGTDVQVVDKNSGDTISSPVGKTPDVFGVLKDAPLYLGTANLLDYGLSDVQIQDVKYAFYKYTTSTTPKIMQVSVSKNITSIPHDRNDVNSKFGLTFNVVFDNKTTLKATLNYFNTDSIELFLYDSSNQLKFDSGSITNQTIQTQ